MSTPPPTPQKVRATLLAGGLSLAGGPPPLFHGLTPRQRDQVLSHGRRIAVGRGATLFSQGTPHDGIYLIETGRIRVFYVAPTGREITLAYWYPGNFVGGPEVFDTGAHAWSAAATMPSSAILLPGKPLRALAMQIPALAMGLIDGLVFKGKCYSALAQMLGTRSVTERLAYLLLHLADTYGSAEPDGMMIGAAFSHADLANMVGSTRQWVTTSLRRLQDDGVLSVRLARLVVHRPQALEQLRREGGE